MIAMPPVFNAGDTVYFPFDTYGTNGASITMSGLAVTDIEVYKNGSTTQRASDNGYALLDTDGTDFDGTTGLHGFSIDTSDNSDASFWVDGGQYWVNVNAITVDSQTVRFTYFLTLGYLLRPTTAGRKLDVSPGGEAGLDLANVGSPTTTLNLSGTTIKTATDVETDTSDIQSRLPAALVSGRMDSSVGVMAANVLTATAIATDAITAAKIAADAIGASELAADAVAEIQSGLSTLTQANIRTAVGLASANLDTQLDALPTAAEVRDAVFAEATGTNDYSANSFGEYIQAIQGAVITSIPATITTLTGRLGAFTGTGVNTVLGFFKGLMSKTASTPSDVGGTFDASTDSTEAIRDRGDAAWTGGGSGGGGNVID